MLYLGVLLIGAAIVSFVVFRLREEEKTDIERLQNISRTMDVLLNAALTGIPPAKEKRSMSQKVKTALPIVLFLVGIGLMVTSQVTSAQSRKTNDNSSTQNTPASPAEATSPTPSSTETPPLVEATPPQNGSDGKVDKKPEEAKPEEKNPDAPAPDKAPENPSEPAKTPEQTTSRSVEPVVPTTLPAPAKVFTISNVILESSWDQEKGAMQVKISKTKSNPKEVQVLLMPSQTIKSAVELLGNLAVDSRSKIAYMMVAYNPSIMTNTQSIKVEVDYVSPDPTKPLDTSVAKRMREELKPSPNVEWSWTTDGILFKIGAVYQGVHVLQKKKEGEKDLFLIGTALDPYSNHVFIIMEGDPWVTKDGKNGKMLFESTQCADKKTLEAGSLPPISMIKATVATADGK